MALCYTIFTLYTALIRGSAGTHIAFLYWEGISNGQSIQGTPQRSILAEIEVSSDIVADSTTAGITVRSILGSAWFTDYDFTPLQLCPLLPYGMI